MADMATDVPRDGDIVGKICSDKTYLGPVNKSEYSATWTIDLSSLRSLKQGEVFSSSYMRTRDGKNLKWRIQIYPKGVLTVVNYVSIFLDFSPYTFDIEMTYNVFIVDSKRRKILLFDSSPPANTYGKTRGRLEAIKQDVLFDKANGLVSEDKLTIFCQLYVTEELNLDSAWRNVLNFKSPFKKHIKEV